MHAAVKRNATAETTHRHPGSGSLWKVDISATLLAQRVATSAPPCPLPASDSWPARPGSSTTRSRSPPWNSLPLPASPLLPSLLARLLIFLCLLLHPCLLLCQDVFKVVALSPLGELHLQAVVKVAAPHHLRAPVVPITAGIKEVLQDHGCPACNAPCCPGTTHQHSSPRVQERLGHLRPAVGPATGAAAGCTVHQQAAFLPQRLEGSFKPRPLGHALQRPSLMVLLQTHHMSRGYRWHQADVSQHSGGMNCLCQGGVSLATGTAVTPPPAHRCLRLPAARCHGGGHRWHRLQQRLLPAQTGLWHTALAVEQGTRLGLQPWAHLRATHDKSSGWSSASPAF